jgi:hypothetical protein
MIFLLILDDLPVFHLDLAVVLLEAIVILVDLHIHAQHHLIVPL